MIQITFQVNEGEDNLKAIKLLTENGFWFKSTPVTDESIPAVADELRLEDFNDTVWYNPKTG